MEHCSNFPPLADQIWASLVEPGPRSYAEGGDPQFSHQRKTERLSEETHINLLGAPPLNHSCQTLTPVRLPSPISTDLHFKYRINRRLSERNGLLPLVHSHGTKLWGYRVRGKYKWDEDSAVALAWAQMSRALQSLRLQPTQPACTQQASRGGAAPPSSSFTLSS